jgi:hypothetical protein
MMKENRKQQRGYQAVTELVSQSKLIHSERREMEVKLSHM